MSTLERQSFTKPITPETVEALSEESNLGLFHRAFTQDDHAIWTVQRLYYPLLLLWVNQDERTKALLEEDNTLTPETLAGDAFIKKFVKAIFTPALLEELKQIGSMASMLAYLKQCVQDTLTDAIRMILKHLRDEAWLMEEAWVKETLQRMSEIAEVLDSKQTKNIIASTAHMEVLKPPPTRPTDLKPLMDAIEGSEAAMQKVLKGRKRGAVRLAVLQEYLTTAKTMGDLISTAQVTTPNGVYILLHRTIERIWGDLPQDIQGAYGSPKEAIEIKSTQKPEDMGRRISQGLSRRRQPGEEKIQFSHTHKTHLSEAASRRWERARALKQASEANGQNPQS